MHWKIAEAKQHFSDVLRQAEDEPQLIFKRERLVAAVVDAEEFETFRRWREHERMTSIADAFTCLRQISLEEHYSVEAPARSDRKNTLLDTLNDLPR